MSTTTSSTDTFTLSLHDALPIFALVGAREVEQRHRRRRLGAPARLEAMPRQQILDIEGADAEFHHAAPRRKVDRDRKSTRLNSSHVEISYAVFCLKKKKKKNNIT